MGNCLVIQQDERNKEIKIMRVDGAEVLKLQPAPSPLKQLPPAGDGIVVDSGLPFPGKAPPPGVAAGADQGVVRVKLVVSKQELKRMLNREAISLEDMVALMRKEASDVVAAGESEQECSCGRSPWHPALESIPEGSDC